MANSKFFAAHLVAMAVFSAAFAQSGDFVTKGKVVDAGGQPIVGATVTYTSIGKRLSWDFSDRNGNFGGKTNIINQGGTSDGISLLPATGPYSLELFDMNGRRIAGSSGSLAKGDPSAMFSEKTMAPTANKLYLVKITTGETVRYRKLLFTGATIKNLSLVKTASSIHAGATAKKAAINDTVRIGKTGYKPARIAISDYLADVGTVTLQANDIEAQVTTLFGQMSKAEKMGQLVMPDFANAPSSNVSTYFLGFVFGGGGAFNKMTGAAGVADQCDAYQKAALTTAKKIPLMIGYDGVHGASAVPGATIFPHNLALGAITDTFLIQKAFRVVALEIRGTGANWTYAPCIAVVRDDRWGRLYEGFSESTELTKVMARNAVLGLQTSDLGLHTAVAATVKHFAGDGGTTDGKNEGTTAGPDSAARAIHLPGFTEAIKVGAATIMPSFSSWCDGVKMHGNKPLLTDWLKTAQKFDGFVVGDWMAQYAVGGTGSAMNTGLDVPMSPMAVGPATGMLADFNGMYGGVDGAARCDDAVKRVLRVKIRMGINPEYGALTDRSLTALVGSAEHRAVARECVRRSLVLLKNENNALPIPKTANVTLMGAAADNIGIQCGAWTVEWQGGLGNIIAGGTTIRAGMASLCTGTLTYSADGSTAGSGDYVVAFLGENPYAETSFPAINLTSDLANQGAPSGKDMANTTNAAVIAKIASAHAAGKKVIVVLVAGRPLDISAVLPNADAFVWACLPGTEGAGVGDVLFGSKATYNFAGKLPFTWPTNISQEPINVGDGKTGLFAFGAGLSY
jgi:beta-glucosidase